MPVFPERASRGRGRAVVGLAVAAALLIAACSSSSGPTPRQAGAVTTTTGARYNRSASAGCDAAAARQPEVGSGTSETMVVDGTARTYLLGLPRGGAPSREWPLLLAFHGFGSKAPAFAKLTGLLTRGTAAGYLVAMPNSEGGGWQLAGPGDTGPQAADIVLTKTLVAHLERRFCVDTARVYAAGFSSGSAFVGTAACDLPGTFAAIGMVSAEFHFHQCAKPVSIMAFHGDHDPVVPYDDGEGLTAPGVQLPGAVTSMDGWAANDGCKPQPVVTTVSSQVVRRTWSCPPGLALVLNTILGGSHAWPGAASDVAAHLTTDQMDATATILAFFREHRLS